jgi:hypothetical protein
MAAAAREGELNDETLSLKVNAFRINQFAIETPLDRRR